MDWLVDTKPCKRGTSERYRNNLEGQNKCTRPQSTECYDHIDLFRYRAVKGLQAQRRANRAMISTNDQSLDKRGLVLYIADIKRAKSADIKGSYSNMLSDSSPRPFARLYYQAIQCFAQLLDR